MARTALTDKCRKLLDDDWSIVLFRNEAGAYTAIAVPDGESLDGEAVDNPESNRIADGPLPSDALYRLFQKMTWKLFSSGKEPNA